MAKPVPKGSTSCYILHLYAVLLDVQVAAGVLSPDEESIAPLLRRGGDLAAFRMICRL